MTGGGLMKKLSGKLPPIYWREVVARAGLVQRASAFSMSHRRRVLPNLTSCSTFLKNKVEI